MKHKGFTTFSSHERGFTLIELLVTISIISILAVIGTTIFSNVQNSTKDSRKKADSLSIAKALENKYSPVTGTYTGVTGSDFAGGSIPAPPDGGTYFADLTLNSTGFRTCAVLSNDSPFCIDSQQGLYNENPSLPPFLFGTPPGSPPPTPTQGPTNTPGPSPTPTPPSGPSQAIFEGDSMSFYYPSQVTNLLGAGWTTVNVSTPGETLIQMLPQAPTQVDPLYSGSFAINYVVLWGGTNDLSGIQMPDGWITPQSANDSYNRIVSYANGRRALGFKVAVLTILPRSAGINPVITPAQFETERQTLNSMLRSNWASFADALVDVAADPRIGDLGDQLNPDYYYDQIHLTTEGQAVVAELTAGALAPLLLPFPPSQYFGHNAIGVTPLDSVPNYMYATKFTMGAQSGNAYGMGVYVGNLDPSLRTYQMAIYSDSGGSPANKIIQTEVYNLITGWNNLSIISTPLSANTSYWLVFITNGANSLRFDGGDTDQWKTTDPVSGGPGNMPASFGPPLNPLAIKQSIRTFIRLN